MHLQIPFCNEVQMCSYNTEGKCLYPPVCPLLGVKGVLVCDVFRTDCGGLLFPPSLLWSQWSDITLVFGGCLCSRERVT